MVNTNKSKRSGKPPNTPIPASTVSFSSRGGVGRTSLVGNHIMVLTTEGNVFDATQAGKYKHEGIAIDLRAYFSQGIFDAYDYYRISGCRTTFTWGTMPQDGTPIGGEIFWCIDKDSRSVETFTETANRKVLQSRTFTNNSIRHTVKWRPHLVDNGSTLGQANAQLEYVQPLNRWMNCSNIDDHRYGTIRLIGQVWDASPYPDNDPVIHIRHWISIEVKGLKSVQPTNAQFERIESKEREGNSKVNSF